MAAAATITSCEAAILAESRRAVGPFVQTVDSLPGDWDDEMLRRFLALVPAVLVSFAGGPARLAPNSELAISAAFVVYVVTGNAGGQLARRVGDAMQPGAYDLVQRLAPRLHGLVIDGAGSCSVSEIQNLWTGTVDRQGLSIYAISLSVPLTLELVPDEDGAPLAPFERLRASFDVPPIREDLHPAWLAGDESQGGADGVDVITLPQT